MAETLKEGQPERHTGAPGAGDAGDRRELEAEQALPGRDLADLLIGSPDVDAQDVLAAAAELIAAPRRGRGRPRGSPNRKNGEMIEYLAALGHRDPWLTLSMIQTADTMSLAKAMGSPVFVDGRVKLDREGNVVFDPADPVKVLALQRQAAADLLPYHHAKQPTQLDLPIGGEGFKRPLMQIGELHGNVIVGDNGQVGLSIFDQPREIVENQALSEGESVRLEGGESHDARNALPAKASDAKSS